MTSPPEPAQVEWEVRQATEDDEPAVVVLNEIVQRLHHHHRPDWFKPADGAAFQPIVRRWMGSPDAIVFVAEDDSTVVGYAAAVRLERPDHPLVHPASYIELDQMVVAPTHRGHGVGRALGRRVIGWAKSQGVQRVEVATWAIDDGAVPVFERLGFAPTVQRLSLQVDL